MEREGLVVEALGCTVENVTIEALQLEELEIVVARCDEHPNEDSGRRARLRFDAERRCGAQGAFAHVGYAGRTTPSAACAGYGSSAPPSSALVQRVRASMEGKLHYVVLSPSAKTATPCERMPNCPTGVRSLMALRPGSS